MNEVSLEKVFIVKPKKSNLHTRLEIRIDASSQKFKILWKEWEKRRQNFLKINLS